MALESKDRDKWSDSLRARTEIRSARWNIPGKESHPFRFLIKYQQTNSSAQLKMIFCTTIPTTSHSDPKCPKNIYQSPQCKYFGTDWMTATLFWLNPSFSTVNSHLLTSSVFPLAEFLGIFPQFHSGGFSDWPTYFRTLAPI